MTNEADRPAIDRHTLDRSALAGVAWATAAKWSTQLFAWAGTIIVARILAPSDFGLLTMASVFMGIVLILSEFGVGTAVVTLRELEGDELGQLNSFGVLLGCAGTLLTVLASYPLGLFFRAPDLPPVLIVVGLTFTISSLQTVPASLLRRELKFRTLALIDLARGLLVPVVTLTGALLGMHYWALALGSVVGATVTTALTLANRRVAFARPHLSGLAPVVRYSRDILVGRLAYVVYQDGDFTVAGRRLGQDALGHYSLAWTLATSPIEKVTMVLNDITPSLFSAAQHDRPSLRRYFLNLSEILCFATFPASIGLALVSFDLVDVVLGPKWESASTPLALLAIYAGARSVSSLYGHLFNAARETRFGMWTSLGLAFFLLTGFIVGSFWGANGIAAAWLVVHPSFSVYAFGRVRKVLDLKTMDYVHALRLGLDGALIMAAVLLVFRFYIAHSWSPTLRLIASILLGAATYAVATWYLHRNRLREILEWLKRVRRGQVAAA